MFSSLRKLLISYLRAILGRRVHRKRGGERSRYCSVIIWNWGGKLMSMGAYQRTSSLHTGGRKICAHCNHSPATSCAEIR
ncbi:hypothetical protein EJB05_27983 [Eragrostis curvula]|uniref:Uncharacterized protein n=1 Tax=Eragrostis curvula TaxID=38414 RepID=A0A5J9UPS9_9POAL|nr:hypothetical protein EJB05_27983 [Eragrostis curvula]